MTGSQQWQSGQAALEEQVRDALEDANGAADLVSRLDLGFVEDGDRYADWHASTPLQPMLRALLYKELQNLSFSELHRHLNSSKSTADAFGFDDLPARTTFGRAWRDRCDEKLRKLLSNGADQIRHLARQQGLLIGTRAIKPQNKQDVSKRTEDRYINEKIEDVTREMQRLVFPVFDFNRAENAKYETDAFLELQSHLGLSHSAAESGTTLFEQDTQREKGPPDADTHLRNIKQLERKHVADYLNLAIGRMATEAKRHMEFSRPADVAIDMTYVAYYGQRDDLNMVYGAPPTKGYDWCFKFATLTVVGDNVKLTLAVKPVQKGEELEGEIVRDLVEKAREHVDIRMLFADREFCTVETMRVLDELGVFYTIPAPKRQRIRRKIERMQGDVKVIGDWVRHGPIADGRTIQPARTNLILLPSTMDESKTVAFTTNVDVQDKMQAKGQVLRYSRRWGIENSYKTIKDFLAWTTSKEFVVRFFYFGFAVLLYNMWLLVDLLVQLSLDIEQRYKPRVTAKRFLNLARKHLAEPG